MLVSLLTLRFLGTPARSRRPQAIGSDRSLAAGRSSRSRSIFARTPHDAAIIFAPRPALPPITGAELPVASGHPARIIRAVLRRPIEGVCGCIGGGFAVRVGSADFARSSRVWRVAGWHCDCGSDCVWHSYCSYGWVCDGGTGLDRRRERWDWQWRHQW